MTQKINIADLAAISEIVHEASGIALDRSKGYLVETRLGSLLRERGVASWAALATRCRRDRKLRDEVVDALTTKETSFFRDPRTFEALTHKLIPEHYERLGPHAPLRIWSAACSTGQEVYSAAMMLREMLGPLAGRRISIVGTDISPTALKQANRGSYSELEVSRGLHSERLQRYFSRDKAHFRVLDELRGLAVFKQLNLLDPVSVRGAGGPFDIVLCRNVAIYFDDDDRLKLFDHLCRAMAPQAVLILGLTETMRNVPRELRRDSFRGVTFYRREPRERAQAAPASRLTSC
ncbi:MAG: chemotaxis protein CheR [Proteobacteria bacterium]|nr:MAG: chemotaxis protein CheR [Pseudomonadota bacterium]PIE17452.1 MAG: chemotaxis protein CheR [Pseudomonadota bacterium]